MNSSLNLTSQRISFVNKISIIQKATSDDETPTPIYLHKEINDISFESVGYSESLVEFLVDRLRHRSCHVKLKVLKILKHVLEHGSKEFQLGLRRQVSCVKECTKFSGTPHPVHGNTPYLMVRNLALEVCEKLYNIDPLALNSANKSAEDVQSPPAKYGGMGPSRTGGAIQGFGNSPAPQPKSIAGTILHEIEKLGTKLSETPADRQAAVLAKLNLSASSSNYQPPVVSPDINEVITPESKEQSPVPLVEQAPEKLVSRHLPGKAGGGWNDDDIDDDMDNNDDCVGESRRDEDGENGAISPESQDMTDSIHKEELHSEEKTLVNDLLVEDPSSSDHKIDFLSNGAVAQFLLKCSKLRSNVILDCICHNLVQADAFVLARSLQLLEGIVYNRQELINIDLLAVKCKAVLVECFVKAGKEASEVENIDRIACGKWKSVQTKAAKLILILQQLSSQKDIYPSRQIASELFKSSIPTPAHAPEVALL